MGNGKKRKIDGQKQNTSKSQKTQKTPTKNPQRGKRSSNQNQANLSSNSREVGQVDSVNEQEELSRHEPVTAVIDEGDDGKVTMEVDGMYLDFQSDVNETESESEKDEEVQLQRGRSRSTSIQRDRRSYSSQRESGECESDDEDRRANYTRDDETDSDIEDDEQMKFFKKWEIFLKKKGLKVIEDDDVQHRHDKGRKEKETRRSLSEGPRRRSSSDQRKRSSSRDRSSRERESKGKNNNATGHRDKFEKQVHDDDNSSEVTIYKLALKRADPNENIGNIQLSNRINDRLSSSEEEGDEKVKRTSPGGDSELIDDLIIQFLGTQRMEGMKKSKTRGRGEAVAHCSNDDPSAEDYRLDMERRIQDRAEQIVREAERAKANIYDVPGRKYLTNNFSKSVVYSMLFDDDYQAVEAHIDQGTIQKIQNGEYVNFAKLLPRDRRDGDLDEKLELVNRGGSVGFVPVNEREKKRISSIISWNTAFRVFSKIYTERFPERATELVEYSHNIHSLAETFVWNNVYRYDREFRYHMERHPDCNWGVVLQRAWTLYLRDKLQYSNVNDQRQNKVFDNNTQKSVKKNNKICYKYNGGKCTYGFNCRFQHNCGVCNKFGHGVHICRKVNNIDNRLNNNMKTEPLDREDFKRDGRANRK